MLMVLRIYPKGEQDKVWDYVINNFDESVSDTVTPIQMTAHIGDNVLGILFNVEKVDDMVKFLTQRIGECIDILDTKTWIFMKTVFLPLPKDRTIRFRRFSIRLQVHPKYYHEVYDELIDFQYPNDIYPIYITYVLGDCDILVSIVAKDLERLNEFASRNISPLKGVDSYDIIEFGRSQRLISQDKWRVLQRAMLHIPPWAAGKLKDKYLYDYDLEPTRDDFAFSGAMVDEL